MIKVYDYANIAQKLAKAMQENDAKAMQEASTEFLEAVCQKVTEDAKVLIDSNATSAVMAQRGYRQLTPSETKFYEGWIEAAKSASPKQAFTDLIEKDGMPETIIEDVYRNLKQNHPLLSKIDFQDVKYLTKWILNKNTADRAVWGEITDEFKKQLQASFEVVNAEQAKLSAFVLLPKDMLALGPVFLDNYVRTILVEALAVGLEYGFVAGSGAKGEPIGLDKDIHYGVNHNDDTGYPRKEKVVVETFKPEEYGKLCAMLAKDENGKLKTFGQVQLICNQIDYLKKIMPATTVLTATGSYANNIFPFPTEVIPVSAGLAEGEAILAILPEYKGMFGSKKNGTIEYSDDAQFIEDIRVYTGRLHAAGRAVDNTSAILLDISNLQPRYITVENVSAEAIPSV